MSLPVPARRAEAGFTLVEMLVSLAVLGLIAALLAGAIGAGGLAARRQAKASDAQGEVEAAQAFLRRRIERLTALTDPQGGGASADISGTVERFDFIAEAPDNAAPDALRRLRLARLANGDVALFSLSRLTGQVDPRDPETRGWTMIRLLTRTDGLFIQYFGPPSAGGQPVWQDLWIHRRAAPQLVRIRVAFPAGDGRVWPDLVVRPRGPDISGCVIDAASGQCGDQA